MSEPVCRWWLRMALWTVAAGVLPAGPLWGQVPVTEDPPAVYFSRPLMPEEQKHRESLYQYVLGLLFEREDQVLEALKAYEKAAELDPKAAAIYRAQVPLYLALERSTEALAASRKVLELDPSDHANSYLYARQLKEAGKAKEAREVLQRTLALPSLKDHPEVTQQIYVDMAEIHESADEFVPAAESFTQAAKILEHPDSLLESGVFTREMIARRAAELHECAGKLYVRGKKYDEAVAAFRRAQRSEPAAAGRLNFNLAQVCLEQNNWREALVFLDGYLRLQPQGTEAYEMKIDLLKKLSRDAEILPWLDQAVKGDPFNQSLKLVAAKAQARARPGEAEKILMDLAAANPTPDLYVGLFQVYSEARSPGKGLALLDKTVQEAKMRPPMPGRGAQAKAMILALRQESVLAKDQVQAALKPSTTELQQDTLMVLAGLADHHRLGDEAERLYRKCLKNITPENEALAYGNLLRLLWKARKVDEVVQVCGDGLRQAKATNHVLFHNDLAKALARQGKHDEALAEANRALAVAAETDRFTLRCLRVRLQVIADRLDRAEAECQAMLKEFPQPAETMEIRYLLSSVYSAARALPKAEEQLDLILKMDPNNATVCNDLGYLWADQNKNLPKAEELIRKALDLDRQQRQAPSLAPRMSDQDNASYVDSLGWVLFRRGQVEAARQELERASALPDGEDPVIWDHLGDVYNQLGQPVRARAAWQRALQFHQQDRNRLHDERYRELQRKFKSVEGAGQ